MPDRNATPHYVARAADIIRPALNEYPDGTLRVSHGQDDVAETVVRLVVRALADIDHHIYGQVRGMTHATSHRAAEQEEEAIQHGEAWASMQAHREETAAPLDATRNRVREEIVVRYVTRLFLHHDAKPDGLTKTVRDLIAEVETNG